MDFSPFVEDGRWNRNLLEVVIQTVVDGIIVSDQAGNIQRYSDSCTDIFQYTRDEVLGRGVEMLLAARYNAAYQRRMRRLMSRQKLGRRQMAIVGRRKDGTEFPMHLSFADSVLKGKPVLVGIVRDTTDLERQRLAHEQENAFLTSIIQSSDEAVLGVSLDGVIRSYNRGAELLYGYQAAEVIGMHARALALLVIPPERQDTEFDLLARADAGQPVAPFETTRIRKDGTRIPVLVSISQVRDSKGRLLGRSFIARDISELKAQEELSAFLNATVESSNDGMVGVGRDGFIKSWNRGAERIYGYRADEAIGAPAIEFAQRIIPPELFAADRERFASALEGSSPKPFETLAVRKDGSRIDVQISISPVCDRKGEVLGISSTARDITERRAHEQEKALLSAVVEHSNDAIYTTALDGGILTWNPAAAKIFGYAPEKIIGCPMSLLVPPECIAQEVSIRARLLRGETIRDYESERIRRNRSRFHASITVSPIRDANGAIIGLSNTVRDITERKRAQARLQGMRDELIHVGRLNELAQLSAGIAHELNQPLAAMLNYSNVARRLVAMKDPAKLEKASQCIASAAEQAQRAGAIIRRMRGFIERRETKRALESINEIIEDSLAVGLVEPQAGGITTIRELAPDLPPVHADGVQLQQVLVNLLRNAAEAMTEASTRELTVSTRLDGQGCIEVSVKDTGRGFSKETADRLFMPFFTTKPGGMGIGLMISRSIVESHGGEITAKSDEGAGATFSFTLPIAAQAAQPATLAPSAQTG